MKDYVPYDTLFEFYRKKRSEFNLNRYEKRGRPIPAWSISVCIIATKAIQTKQSSATLIP